MLWWQVLMGVADAAKRTRDGTSNIILRDEMIAQHIEPIEH
jgi:hypothetical protein